VKRQDARDAKELREPDGDLVRDLSDVVDAAVEVHRELGPGFLGSTLAPILAALTPCVLALI